MRKRNKTLKERGIRSYVKEITAIFNPLITSIQVCQRCNKRNAKFHCSHILPVGEYKSLRFNPVNVLCLCYTCHLEWWHKNPLEAQEWFKAKFPERYIFLMEARKKIVKMNVDKYKTILQMVREHDLRGLMQFPT